MLKDPRWGYCLGQYWEPCLELKWDHCWEQHLASNWDVKSVATTDLCWGLCLAC